jgi:hypothetical protein
MSVRAKFKVDEFKSSLQMRPAGKTESGSTKYETVEMRTVVMSPVYGNGDPNHENTKFWNASPAGRLELGTVNPEAWKQFELGKEYYIDFTPAES